MRSSCVSGLFPPFVMVKSNWNLVKPQNSEFDVRFELLQEIVLAIHEHDDVLESKFESWAHPTLSQVLGHDQIVVFIILVFVWVSASDVVVGFFSILVFLAINRGLFLVISPVLRLVNLITCSAFAFLFDDVSFDFRFWFYCFSFSLLLKCHF